MAGIPGGVTEKDYDELQVVARSVLLDGLEALRAQAGAVTIVGAQAIYLRSVDVELTIPTFTTDADFGLDLDLLGDIPLVQEAMATAGFHRRDANQPGLWVKSQRVAEVIADIGVDLLVGEAFAGDGSRSVQMPPHDKMAARRVDGLEAAVLDADLMSVPSLRPGDERTVAARVAGPAALLIAKARKIAERVAEPGQTRLGDKDAADVVRIMLAAEADDVAERFTALLADERVGPAAARGLDDLRTLFGAVRTPGTSMAMRALGSDPLRDAVPDIAGSFLADLP